MCVVHVCTGNVFVILSVTVFRHMRKLSNALIVSLATADLLVAILVLPLSLQFETAGRRWLLGWRACDYWITADVFCCSASILNIVVIAADRYWLITRNVQYTHGSPFSRRRICAIMVTCAWLAALAISSPPVLGWKSTSGDQAVQQQQRVEDAAETRRRVDSDADSVMTSPSPLVASLAPLLRSVDR